MKLLREREKGVLRAAHPCTPFQGEYPLATPQARTDPSAVILKFDFKKSHSKL